jgi:serine/threonine protein phosphatase PrpC
METKGQINAHLGTATGLVREHNEDFVDLREPTDQADEQQNGWIYLVADGVGGADAGEVASKFASQQMIEHYLADQEEPEWGLRLLNAMQAANVKLRQLVADREDNCRMATTMVAAVFHENQVFIGNVGDSRAYHWRRGLFQQVTKDQSLVAKLVEEGAISEAEALSHPRRNVILYSLGSENQPKIDLFEEMLLPGDILLLCSDGLTRHVTDDEISDILNQETPESAKNKLIQLANQRGGEDNISVIVIQYDGYLDKETAVAKTTPTAEIPVDEAQANKALLWVYTGFLAAVLVFLIFITWLVLRV